MRIYIALLYLISVTELVTASVTNSTSSSDLKPFIVGGVEATKNEFPWLVHLEIRRSDGASFCGGALLKMNKVLTAAHCVVGAISISVTAGDHDLTTGEGTEQSLMGESVRSHENYEDDDEEETGKQLHDIAVIQLVREFRQTTAVSSISLPVSDAVINSTSASTGTVAGWGTTRSNGGQSPSLLKVEVPIVTGSSCIRLVRDEATQFCAGASGKDSCQGDSGGPFLCHDLPNQVCGIVSYGYGCGVPGNPGVYTKVSAYLEWINMENPATTPLSSGSARAFFLPNMLLILCLIVKFN